MLKRGNLCSPHCTSLNKDCRSLSEHLLATSCCLLTTKVTGEAIKRWKANRQTSRQRNGCCEVGENVREAGKWSALVWPLPSGGGYMNGREKSAHERGSSVGCMGWGDFRWLPMDEGRCVFQQGMKQVQRGWGRVWLWERLMWVPYDLPCQPPHWFCLW